MNQLLSVDFMTRQNMQISGDWCDCQLGSIEQSNDKHMFNPITPGGQELHGHLGGGAYGPPLPMSSKSQFFSFFVYYIIYVYILAHHAKNNKSNFQTGRTVSRSKF